MEGMNGSVSSRPVITNLCVSHRPSTNQPWRQRGRGVFVVVVELAVAEKGAVHDAACAVPHTKNGFTSFNAAWLLLAPAEVSGESEHNETNTRTYGGMKRPV